MEEVQIKVNEIQTATGNRKWNWKNIDITERIGYDDCTFNEDEESYILFFFVLSYAAMR